MSRIANIRKNPTISLPPSFQFISCPQGGQAGQAIKWPQKEDFNPNAKDSFTHIAPMMYTSPYSYSLPPRPWGTIDIDFNVAYCINAPGSISSNAKGLDRKTNFDAAAKAYSGPGWPSGTCPSSYLCSLPSVNDKYFLGLDPSKVYITFSAQSLYNDKDKTTGSTATEVAAYIKKYAKDGGFAGVLGWGETQGDTATGQAQNKYAGSLVFNVL